MPHIRTSSRRVPPLRDSDYDHEISLVDRNSVAVDDVADAAGHPPSTDGAADGEEQRSTAPLSPKAPSLSTKASPPPSAAGPSGSSGAAEEHAAGEDDALQQRATGPSIEVVGPEASKRPSKDASLASSRSRIGRLSQRTTASAATAARSDASSAIDVLYENERGGILCGIPLFSSAALGNLDPPAWTNAAHKPSPTSIHTAQVPDPSWEWAWPEWRINRDPGRPGNGGKRKPVELDKDGWEYSFAFSKCFSWHGPRWWNSFVRRRAWIRKRRRRPGYNAAAVAVDPTSLDPLLDPDGPEGALPGVPGAGDMGRTSVDADGRPAGSLSPPIGGTVGNNQNRLNPDYFVVKPAVHVVSHGGHSRTASRASVSSYGDGASDAASGIVGGRTSSIRSGGRRPLSLSSLGLNAASVIAEPLPKPDRIEDADELVEYLRHSRIDREKIEAVDSYLAHAVDDLEGLQHEMHDIMALFVFQASRHALLARLIEVHDATDAAVRKAEAGGEAGPGPQEGQEQRPAPAQVREDKGKAPEEAPQKHPEEEASKTKAERNNTLPLQVSPSPQLQPEVDPLKPWEGESYDDYLARLRRRAKNLAAAVEHADEEVRALEYWSDIKEMANAGLSRGAMSPRKGWATDGTWEGLDKSGPAHPCEADVGKEVKGKGVEKGVKKEKEEERENEKEEKEEEEEEKEGKEEKEEKRENEKEKEKEKKKEAEAENQKLGAFVAGDESEGDNLADTLQLVHMEDECQDGDIGRENEGEGENNGKNEEARGRGKQTESDNGKVEER